MSGDNNNDPGVLGGDTSQQLPKSLKSAPENASQQPGFGHSVSNTFGQKLSSRFSLKSLLRFPSHDRFGTHQEDTSDQQQLLEIRNPLAMLPGSNHSHENGGQAEARLRSPHNLRFCPRDNPPREVSSCSWCPSSFEGKSLAPKRNYRQILCMASQVCPNKNPRLPTTPCPILLLFISDRVIRPT